MYGIETSQSSGKLEEVFLTGEYDLSRRDELKRVLGAAASKRESSVDLSEVTFMDLGCVRELAFYGRIHPDGMTLINPSWQVLASTRACGLESWLRFNDSAGQTRKFSNIA